MTWKSRIVREYEVAPDQLLAHPLNARRHPASQRDALDASLDTLGWIQRIVVNARTGHVIDGHARAEQAISRGEVLVPVIEVDLSEEEERLALAVFDPISAMATYDQETLAELLEGVTVDSEALSEMLAGLKSPEPKEGNTDPDAVPDEPEKPYVQPGDVYALGEHRIMCGDSTSAEDVALLLDGAKPALMVTDPPYGVEYDPEWRAEAGVNKNRRKMGTVVNDDRVDWGEAWSLFSGDVAYAWSPPGRDSFGHFQSLEAAGFVVRTQIVWAKDRFALSRGHYHWHHEPCWYAVRKGETAHWIGDRSQSTIWQIPAREDSGHGHSTQKPVECMERPLRNHSGDVYDPFIGSGTTLIAAERQSRRCYGMEIEPKYVQVAIERWEQYTGQKAVKVDG